MYGLSSHTIQAIQGVFAAYPQLEQAILYGSRARGNYRNGSDIDLTLLGSALNLSHLHAIETKLDDLLLPYYIDMKMNIPKQRRCSIAWRCIKKWRRLLNSPTFLTFVL